MADSRIVISSEARNLCHSRLRDSRFPSHVPRTSPLSLAVFHAASALSRPFGASSTREEGCFYTLRHLDPSTQFSYFQISHF